MRIKTKTTSKNDIQDKWYVVDVAGVRLGNAASEISKLLLGKKDPLVRDYNDPRAFVVVLNADKLDITPKKLVTKFYKKYSGYPGGLTFDNLKDKIEKDPLFPLDNAVKGMLPKNTRGRTAYTRMKLFAGDDHPHEAQNPVVIDIKTK